MRLSGSNLIFSSVETHIVKAIEFGLMNPEDIVINKPRLILTNFIIKNLKLKIQLIYQWLKLIKSK